MTTPTWTADELKANRVSTLLYGGGEADRRAFAIAASQSLEGAGFIEAKDAASVEKSLNSIKAVVYVADVGVLPPATQRVVVRTLREREERPKLVIGLSVSPDTAFERGILTEDLKFWLTSSTVDVKSAKSKR